MRSRILDAAEALFLAHGFVKTSLRDIAAMADIELGLLSYYFKRKEALIRGAPIWMRWRPPCPTAPQR